MLGKNTQWLRKQWFGHVPSEGTHPAAAKIPVTCVCSLILSCITYRMSSALNYKLACTRAKRAMGNEFAIATITGQ